MSVTRIHQGKTPVRRHFLEEWLEERRMSVPDLVAALNDPERSSDLREVDKSQAYRWIKGQMPQQAQQVRIAAVLSLDDPGDLFRHPNDDWFSRVTRGQPKEEVERMKQMIEIAFRRTA